MKYFAAVTLVLAMISVGSAWAEDKAEKPKDSALKATLTSKKDSYTLDPAQQGAAFRKKLEDAKEKGEALPKPPTVDMVLTITNSSKDAVVLHIGGDESRIMLNLTGEGAVSVEANMMMTMDYKMGKPTTIAAGKSIEIPIKSLAYGARGVSAHAYWTEPGEYTLSATLTAQTPGKEQPVTVTSEPLKVKVEAKK